MRLHAVAARALLHARLVRARRPRSPAPPAPRPPLLSIVHPWPDLAHVVPVRELHDRVSGNASTLSIVFALMCGISGSALLASPLQPQPQDSQAGDNEAACIRLHELLHLLTSASFATTLGGLMCASMTLAAIHSTPVRAARVFVRRHALLIAVYGWLLAPASLSLASAAAVAAEIRAQQSERLRALRGAPFALLAVCGALLVLPCASILRANHAVRVAALAAARSRHPPRTR